MTNHPKIRINGEPATEAFQRPLWFRVPGSLLHQATPGSTFLVMHPWRQ